MKEERNCCVYCHTNKFNGKKYIGFTSQKPEVRWKNGYGYKLTTYFRNAIDKWGWNSFVHEVLFTGLSEEEAKQIEKDLIAEYHTNDKRYGYNLTIGGEGTNGYHHTDEAKENMRNKKLGSDGYWTGKHLSDEHKEKLSKSHIGENAGVPRSEETKRKISETHKKNGKNKGKKMPEEQKELISANSPFKKKVAQVDVVTGNIINIFDSLTEAAKFAGVDLTCIVKCCKGRIKTSGGFIWKYIED